MATLRDGSMLVDMLIPLSVPEAIERSRKFIGKAIEWNDVAAYTCRHWDESSRLCQVYETRPNMCRKFPEDNPCHGCGLMPAEAIEREAIYAEANA